jgi:HEAT repeat protein
VITVPSLFSDDPVESMETAKKIIGGRLKASFDILAATARDKGRQKWPRIAAIYTLGFVGGDRASAPLRKLLVDPDEDAEVRSHAAEALGNIADRGAIKLLRELLARSPQPKLRESCEYALSELDAA